MGPLPPRHVISETSVLPGMHTILSIVGTDQMVCYDAMTVGSDDIAGHLTLAYQHTNRGTRYVLQLRRTMTSLLYFLYDIVEQFVVIVTTFFFYMIPYKYFSFHARNCPLRVIRSFASGTDLCEGILELRVITTTAWENLCMSTFKVLNSVLEINLHPKPLFSDGSDSTSQVRKWCKMMTIVVEWQ